MTSSTRCAPCEPPAALAPAPLSPPTLAPMAVIAAVATQAQQDGTMELPLLRAVKGFLSIELLMPPMRLHWSRILGRPMMEDINLTDGQGEIGPVFIDEVAGKECLISYRCLNPQTGHREFVNTVPAADALSDREHCWFVRVMDATHADVPFERDWRARYGVRWPLVSPHATHSLAVLQPLRI